MEKLPPTEGAAAQHCFRVYLQIQTWLGNEKDATDWGWKNYADTLRPKYTEDKLIPDELLKKICCTCNKPCETLQCGCRKHGLQCTNLCTKCDSDSCTNFENIVASEETSDSEETYDEEPGDFAANFLQVHIDESEESLNFPEEDESVCEPPTKIQRKH